MQEEPFRLVRQVLGPLPILDRFIERIGLPEHLTEATRRATYARATAPRSHSAGDIGSRCVGYSAVPTAGAYPAPVSASARRRSPPIRGRAGLAALPRARQGSWMSSQACPEPPAGPDRKCGPGV